MVQGFPQLQTPFVTRTGHIDRQWLYLLESLWNRTGGSGGEAGFSTGDFLITANTSERTGWLLCNGQLVSRTTYADLFGVIGEAYGAGDGSTTFRVPDCTDRTILGVGAYSLGASGGSDSLTIDVANLPSHSHSVTDAGHSHAVTDPGHLHVVTTGTAAGPGVAINAALANRTPTSPQPTPNIAETQDATTGLTVDSATTGVTVGNTGSGTALPSLPPFTTAYVFIKT